MAERKYKERYRGKKLHKPRIDSVVEDFLKLNPKCGWLNGTLQPKSIWSLKCAKIYAILKLKIIIARNKPALDIGSLYLLYLNFT